MYRWGSVDWCTAASIATPRPGLVALLDDSVNKLSLLDLQAVAQFMDQVKRRRLSMMMPAEEFVIRMAKYSYQGAGALTPDVVASEVDPKNPDGFWAEFGNACTVAKAFREQYPNPVIGGAE
jgi:hypothetical protein